MTIEDCEAVEIVPSRKRRTASIAGHSVAKSKSTSFSETLQKQRRRNAAQGLAKSSVSNRHFLIPNDRVCDRSKSNLKQS